MKQETGTALLEEVLLDDERFFKIPDSDALRPFFMSIVSDSNHWMFISSNGGLTAGRKNAQFSLFPYYTDDKITESTDTTGSKTLFRVTREGTTSLWEPFSIRQEGKYNTTRNLYKNIYGNKVAFEEINHDLQLCFRYEWNSSNTYGFVRKATLSNLGKGTVGVSLLDGIQNLLPYGVGSDLQNRQSNLVDAYKRNELLEGSGLGVYALSAIIVDKAEPSEALKANIAWSLGLSNPTYLVSSRQLEGFRNGEEPKQETDVKAEKGAYFVHSGFEIPPGQEEQWMIVANLNQDQVAVAALAREIREDLQLKEKVLEDVERGTQKLIQLCAASDGLQCSNDNLRDTRHFANTLFNIMRGGIFDDAYHIEKWDFEKYLRHANPKVFSMMQAQLEALPEVFSLSQLKELANGADNADFKRLSTEYLPLKFSRRHGDPSRPWNIFSINTRSEVDGSKILDYQGNWRDIFQNWEALAHSYPDFMDGMISKFLNASTFDGYNPYRVTKDGFDWEVIEPDDPWSYIGYWGDHQIIYLLKFLEFSEKYHPGRLSGSMGDELFVYANVPYRIKDYQALLKNPKDTIDFDHDADRRIREDRQVLGADGALLRDAQNAIHRVNLLEKILATLLAKLSNFIPEGGIWMNTQRPEWNDANNALVGNGVSMVTLYYLRRFLAFLKPLLQQSEVEVAQVSSELMAFFEGIAETLVRYQDKLGGKIDDQSRRQVLDGLGSAGSKYREAIYRNSFSGEKQPLQLKALEDLVDVALEYLEHSIRANQRTDNLYHAYNLMSVEKEGGVSVSYLSEMLEGQVAVLSSGYLSPEQCRDVLNALKDSALFREDQYSYLLYPNKDLPRFMEKNCIPDSEVAGSKLLRELLDRGDVQIIKKDVGGAYHFNGNFRNAQDLKSAFDLLSAADYTYLNEEEISRVLAVFEKVFNHKAFTGRSGTFFGYEGLGSIYWHMVSKLLLATQECCQQAIDADTDAPVIGRLLEHYYEINEGIGVHKPPSLYGAFPTDPYSHTPQFKGAQQPGMTGQVKEDILSRFGELGIVVREGCLHFMPGLLRKGEFLSESRAFNYVDVGGNAQLLELDEGSLCFTVCQVPVVYALGNATGIEVQKADGTAVHLESGALDVETSRQVFERSGEVLRINVSLETSILR
jgi:hypothetical protein